MSYKDVFEMRFVGRSGPSSMPQKNIDPIVARRGVHSVCANHHQPQRGPAGGCRGLHLQVHGHAAQPGGGRRAAFGQHPHAGRSRAARACCSASSKLPAARRCLRVPLKLDMHPIVPGVNNPPPGCTAFAGRGRGLSWARAVAQPPVNLASEDFFPSTASMCHVLLFSGLRRAGAAAIRGTTPTFTPDGRTPSMARPCWRKACFRRRPCCGTGAAARFPPPKPAKPPAAGFGQPRGLLVLLWLLRRPPRG